MTNAAAEEGVCSICGSAALSNIEGTLGGTYRACSICGYCEQALEGCGRPDRFEAEQRKHYEDDSLCSLAIYARLQAERARRRIAAIQAHLPGGELLEVGPGNAETLLAVRQNGYTVTAVEHSSVLGERISKEFDIPVHIGDFQTMWLPAEKYDGFLSFHVIEHVADPEAHLRKAAGLVRRGGFAFVATPNARSWEHRISGRFSPNYSTAHLQLFTESSLCQLLKATGWTVVDIRTPSYVDAWLRVMTSFLRRCSAVVKPREPSRRGLIGSSDLKTKLLIDIARVLSAPGRYIQEKAMQGNEIMIVAERR